MSHLPIINPPGTRCERKFTPRQAYGQKDVYIIVALSWNSGLNGSMETERFVGYYNEMAQESTEVLARDPKNQCAQYPESILLVEDLAHSSRGRFENE